MSGAGKFRVTLFGQHTVPGLILLPILVLAVCQNAFSAGMPRAQKHEIRHDVLQMEDAWREAILKANAAKMESLLADDYLAITSSGILQTKQQTLANLTSGRIHFSALLISERKVRFYGSTALVTSLAEVQGTNSEGRMAGSYRYTRVYARDPHGAWKIVSFEASKIRDSGDHR